VTGGLERYRDLLAALGDHLRDAVLAGRDHATRGALAEVVGSVDADVIYAVDRIGDEAVLAWFAEHWPEDEPVRLVMEGIEDHEVVTFPAGTAPGALRWTCIVDPIDGTRNLMFDKRPAWVLAALARGAGAHLTVADLEVAAMTEIPVVKQWRADQYRGVRGGGVLGTGLDLRTGMRTDLTDRPTTTTGLAHGFASFAHAFPDAKALLATIDQDLWELLVPAGPHGRPVFEDQYLCSAGQLHEVLTGRDRLVGDLRPLANAQLGLTGATSAHPYDVCTGLLLAEAGGVVEDPWGGPVRVPLDTTSPVAWLAYANPALAARVRPALAEVLARHIDGAILHRFGAPDGGRPT
jgi:fructose-1,6-bisphosphatase/inositol monophosphatase family enzyme